ncbi:MAG: DnaJ domain-containing protein [Thermodesulfobacteriota bacterium]|nr:DnaJ domain-containing protein [Thermodesulfobacteriota bacterium]
MKYLPWLIAFLYFINPYDLLPDFIVGPGWLDDFGVLGLAWWWANRLKRAYQAGAGLWKNETNQQGSTGSTCRTDEELYKDADPYEILGIERGASKADINAAYKKLASQYHPDKVHHLGMEFQEFAHKKFVAIQKAHDLLMK